MENLGSLAILFAFLLSVFATLGSLLGAWKDRPYLVASAERAVYAIWGLLSVASGLLIYALLNSDFRLAYVAAHSNREMPVLYKFAAWWGGQEGSLLFWAWILASYTAVVVFSNRKKHRRILPYVVTILGGTLTFFTLLIAFVVSPFEMLAVGKLVTAVPDGNGLNPLLQHPAMAIHPPMLYLGYVGFTVPFAFAMASLIRREPGEAWIHTTRRWTLVTWLFQSVGILLGAGWAYEVLGWGGYWGWDPVENASLLPWITGTAFLHSVMMQEKKGMMKVWNMVLISATFLLCIFGTFLTRSGIVSSVHAFAQSPIGNYFITFMAIAIGLVIYLILDRMDFLRTESRLDSVMSRESSFLFNNLLLLASCFAVLWGTLFPVLSEAFTGEKISVDAPFFNRVMVPIGLFLLLLTGVGPLFAWRRTSVDSLRRNFLWPGVAGLVLMVVLVASGMHHAYAAISFGFCLFVAIVIVTEFVKGAGALGKRTGQWMLPAMLELTHRNTRRYGGYIVHMAIVIMFVGFTGAAFNKELTLEVPMGGSFQIAGYELRVREITNGQTPNYVWNHAKVDAYVNGRFLVTLEPERRFYESSRQSTSEVAIRRAPREDLYINFAGTSEDGQKAVIQAYVFPLVSWIWVGAWMMFLGTFVCLVPSKVDRQMGRTKLVSSQISDMANELEEAPVARAGD
ncbi:MAG: heme lyase CcmF/NrfE family subunit [Bryobacterales bacterium]|jgi:cytochrome c-type biogenesis protein CcmF|nr:heme lyase CcmF/NrfE family subunit [Bryobacterales bacterium]